MQTRADFLLVTATKVEALAVLEAFERETGTPAEMRALGEKTYHFLGVVNDAAVWLVQSEMGAGGLGAALLTVQKGIAVLKPKAVILVGIAFGIKPDGQAIGDVLVSRQILLYELQRVGTEGRRARIIPRGDRPHCSSWLLDRFRNSDLHQRWRRYNVHFGLVLSGEKLVDNVEFRQQLGEFASEAIGGEMEGAGLYVACQDANVEWIVVKGICDWADGRKREGKTLNQELAARNAARFIVQSMTLVSFSRESSHGAYGFDEPAVREHRRVDAAIPSNAALGELIDLLVQVRTTSAPHLGIEDWPLKRSPDSVEQASQAVNLSFRRNPLNGELEPATLNVRVIAPDFKVEGADEKGLTVESMVNSEVVSFLLQPKKLGHCRVNVEVWGQDQQHLGTIPVETLVGEVAMGTNTCVASLVLVVFVPNVSERVGSVPRRERDPRQEAARQLEAKREQLEAEREQLEAERQGQFEAERQGQFEAERQEQFEAERQRNTSTAILPDNEQLLETGEEEEIESEDPQSAGLPTESPAEAEVALRWSEFLATLPPHRRAILQLYEADPAKFGWLVGRDELGRLDLLRLETASAQDWDAAYAEHKAGQVLPGPSDPSAPDSDPEPLAALWPDARAMAGSWKLDGPEFYYFMNVSLPNLKDVRASILETFKRLHQEKRCSAVVLAVARVLCARPMAFWWLVFGPAVENWPRLFETLQREATEVCTTLNENALREIWNVEGRPAALALLED